MILTESEIKDIIVKQIGEIPISLSLGLIQTYIQEKKGKDIGEISKPVNRQFVLPELLRLGVSPICNDNTLCSYLAFVAINYYKEKYKENGTV